MTQQALLAEVEAALEKIGMSPSLFGEQAVGDRSFVFDLREGRDIRMSTAEKVRKFIAQQGV